jgi:sigma-B regulation protein RsbU (phosphoserine phosphatase)
MLSRYRYYRLRLSEAGLLPKSKLAQIAWYLLGLDLLLFALQRLLALFRSSYGAALGAWVTFLSLIVIVLFGFLGMRWAKGKMLWRLRNRLIVTYVFIGVIPVVLLVALTGGSLYLFAGQFATFIVTTELNSELRGLEAANSAIAHELAARMQRGGSPESEALESLRRTNKSWSGRHVHVWLDGKLILSSSPKGVSSTPPPLPSYLNGAFAGVVRHHDKLSLRAAETIPIGRGKLTVLSSEPLDRNLLEVLATDLGEITLYASGLTLSKIEQPGPAKGESVQRSGDPKPLLELSSSEGNYVLDTGKDLPTPTITTGSVPPPARAMDRQVSFATAVRVVDWETGEHNSPAAISVQTRLSKLYDRLFGALGEFAPAIEYSLLIVAVVFALIELVALWVSLRLTRSVTGAVAHLYRATQYINRGDFSHRIPIRSSDQLAALANSFNSMTASLEQLIREQKEKQRLENELVIAQEVQAQLFPRKIEQLDSLEVHGFCRPARTVSGDYYDFLKLDSDRLLLAVGDISGKGISAALLMATIHSAVRAYSLEGIPLLREPIAVGGGGSGMSLGSSLQGAEVSPSTLLLLLNHQLYESTPMEKYATLFLAIYEGDERRLTYSNGGHLPPIILTHQGSVRKLDRGGTVVGMFSRVDYDEGSTQLRRGDIFIAYSDGVTEPENEFGEFGEERLIDIVQENRDLPLERITEVVTAAVDDWIGDHEQPDDVTLVLARAR